MPRDQQPNRQRPIHASALVKDPELSLRITCGYKSSTIQQSLDTLGHPVLQRRMRGGKQKAGSGFTNRTSWRYNRGFKDVPSVKHASRPRRIDVGTLDPAGLSMLHQTFSFQLYSGNDSDLVSSQCNNVMTTIAQPQKNQQRQLLTKAA